MPALIHRFLFPAAVAILANVVPLAAQRSEAGYVLAKEGQWFASSHPSRPLSIGEEVQEGDSVWTGRNPSAINFLSIALYSGGERFKVECSQRATCSRRHGIPASPPGEGRVSRLWRAVRARFTRQPSRYVASITRNHPAPGEAVLIRDSAGVDLAPVLTRIAPGPLRLEAAALDSAAVPGERRALQVEWNPGSPALVPLESLPPGLYALLVVGENDSWILVMDASPEAAEAAAGFQELAGQVQEWHGESACRDSRMVLRALLHHLSRQGVEPGLAQ
jgi:hypothetical protein